MPLDEVLPDLFVSGLNSTKRYILEENEIKTVLTIREYPNPFEPNCDILYHHIGISDTSDQDLSQHFQNITDIISSGLQQGKVLVHCQGGMSRSVSGIIAYMVSVFNIDYQTALKIMRENHRTSFPNSGFAGQLERWAEQTKSSWEPTPAYIYHKDRILEPDNMKKFQTIKSILKKRKK